MCSEEVQFTPIQLKSNCVFRKVETAGLVRTLTLKLVADGLTAKLRASH